MVGLIYLQFIWFGVEELFIRPSRDQIRLPVALSAYLGVAIVAPIFLIIAIVSVWLAHASLLVLGCAGAVVWMYHAWPRRPAHMALVASPFAGMSVIEWACALIILVQCFFGIVLVLVPVTGWDSVVAHLAIPSAYVRAKYVGLVEGNVYSAYPQLLHIIFSVIHGSAHQAAVLACSWYFGVLASISVGGLAWQLGGRTAGFVAAAMFITSPIFVAQMGTVAIDIPFTGFIASALLGLVIWDETKSARFLTIAGVIAGAACGIRHTGYLAAFLMFVWVVVQSRENRAKLSGFFAASVAIASAPWWLRSWILVGNPVYPLLTSVFGDGGMPDVQVTAPLQHETARSAGVLDLLTFPWRIVMRPESFDGWQASPGGLVLALGVVGVLWGGRMARWLGGFSLAGIVTIYMVQRFARYLAPFFMPLHVTGALAAVRPGPLRRPIAMLLVLTYIYGAGLAVAANYHKWPVVFGRESREEYLTRRVERYPAFQWLNEHLPKDAVVLTLDPRSFYIQRESFQNLAALEELREKSVEDQLAWMEARQIRYIFIPDAYVAGSPIFRERGLAPLVEQWRADSRFRAIYDEELPDPRSGGTEHVTILEVVGGDGGGPA